MIIDLENPNLEELIVELKRIGTLEDRMERSKEVEPPMVLSSSLPRKVRRERLRLTSMVLSQFPPMHIR